MVRPYWRAGSRFWPTTFRTPARRTHATAVWGTSVGLGISLGALLSAVAGAARWREPYLVVGVLALILLWPSISRIGESRAASRRRLDGIGLALFATAMVLLLCALTFGRDGIDVPTVLLASTGLVALVAFAFAELRVRDPLIDPNLLRHSRFRAATIGSLTLGAGVTATVSFIPTLAQVGLGSGCGRRACSSSRGRAPAWRRRTCRVTFGIRWRGPCRSR